MYIGRLAGIPIHLHWSFLALVGVYGLVTVVSSGWIALGTVAVLGVILFGSVVLHELGHALAARAFGVDTADITLYPFGGVASIKAIPTNPTQELLIAIAGPAVNAVLFLMAAVVWVIVGGYWVAAFALLNLMMGVFNLIPAFPMDGGRVLRAFLSMSLGFWRASDIAIWVGRGFAVLFLLIGLVLFSPNLLIIGGFLLVATAGEARRLAWMKRHGLGPEGRTYLRPGRNPYGETRNLRPRWPLNHPLR